MRTFLLILVAVVILSGGYLGYAHLSGGAVPTFGLKLGGTKAEVRAQALRFFENFKFKNKEQLLDLIGKHSRPEELDGFLNHIFEHNPNEINLEKIKISSVELDSAEKRSRVKVELIGENVALQKKFDRKVIVFLYYDEIKYKWLLDIVSFSN